MSQDWLGKLQRGLRKPPRYVIERLGHELLMQFERLAAPRRSSRLTALSLSRKFGESSVQAWWKSLATEEYFSCLDIRADEYAKICPGDHDLILQKAERAHRFEIDLLGSGLVSLGFPIDWHKDYKTGFRWEPEYYRNIEYSNPERPSDVKFPWELSRMQWLIPVGQAYLLDGEERHAMLVRRVLDDWIASNSYAFSVNWSCTMEVALRLFTWTWFFHVFNRSESWQDKDFQERLLQAIYLHGDFTSRNLEKSDINGNHYTADAAGLVVAGLFFGLKHKSVENWADKGWEILRDEFPRQVFTDGVDFEASVPYHRLVMELFLFPAIFRLKRGLDVPVWYRDRLVSMAGFSRAYTQPDGSAPLWGDADDARTLPFGSQPINDHRYLVGAVGALLGVDELKRSFSGSRSEICWLLGTSAAGQLSETQLPESPDNSMSFPHGGFYILRNASDHIFIDCGPLGLGGRGGHGHNDLLSFEAVLRNIKLVSDCGAYLYTASYEERNLFRSTAYHNTPRIDGQEINRYIRPDYLWNLHNDASPSVRQMAFGENEDVLVVTHTGYQRLDQPVLPVRTFRLHHVRHSLEIEDSFEGAGTHDIEVPLHLNSDVQVTEKNIGQVVLTVADTSFLLTWSSDQRWQLAVEDGRVSPSYGIFYPTKVLRWRRGGELASLKVKIEPMGKLSLEGPR